MPPKKQKPFEDTLYGDYFRLTAQYVEEYGPNTIVLYQNGAFLEMYSYFNSTSGVYYGSKMSDVVKTYDLHTGERYRFTDPYDGREKIVYMAGFTLEYSAEKYINKLSEQYTIILYLQTENKANTTRYLHSIISPGTYLGTTTDTTAGTSAGNTLSNNIVCVWIHKAKGGGLFSNSATKTQSIHVGISAVNIFTGETSIFQYKKQLCYNDGDKDLTVYDDLANFLYIARPNEVIFIYDAVEITPILNYLGYDGSSSGQCLIHKIDMMAHDMDDITSSDATNPAIIQHVRAHNCGKQAYQMQVLSRFYEGADKVGFMESFMMNDLATQSFVFLLEFIHRHNPNLVRRLTMPVFENHSSSLVLANHSLRQLNILDDGITSADATTKRHSCVLNLLNMCITPMGQRKFAYDLLHPIYPRNDAEVATLTREYDMTDSLLQLPATEFAKWGATLSELRGDIAKFERQIMDRKLPPSNLVHIYNNAQQMIVFYHTIKSAHPHLLSYFNGDGDGDGNSNTDTDTDNVTNTPKVFEQLSAFIESRIDLQIAKSIGRTSESYDEIFIRPSINIGLSTVHKKYAAAKRKLDDIREYFCGLIGGGDDTVKLNETDKDGIITLTTTDRRTTLIEAGLPAANTTNAAFGITKGQLSYTRTGNATSKATKTTVHYKISNLMLDKLCEDVRMFKKDMQAHIVDVYTAILETIATTYQPNMMKLSRFITAVDVAYSKAVLARKYGYCKPTIAPMAAKSFIHAQGLRHPLIERLTTSGYVPNDIDFNKDIDSPTGILLYGTNMVGKTSFIKSIGIAVIMAQAGLYVPATTFVYAPYQYIFTRILGNDNLFKGLSTFATEMIELRTILQMANKNSLVIGDELCSGTETASAMGIFMAGIKHLYGVGSSFIFATHLHEVAEDETLKLMTALRLCHMKVQYNRETDDLVYDRKICEGSGDTMYGLEVCNYLKLPAAFMEEAYKYRGNFIAHKEPDILTLRPSRYNSQKLKGQLCERCGAVASTEIHHTAEQHTANEAGLVKTKNGGVIHKNHVSNLVALCEKCHLAMHGH